GPVAGIVAILVLAAVAPARVAVRRAHDAIALLALIASGAAVLWLASGGQEISTLCVPGGSDLRSCSFVSSTLTLTLQGLVAAAAAVCLLLAADGAGPR